MILLMVWVWRIVYKLVTISQCSMADALTQWALLFLAALCFRLPTSVCFYFFYFWVFYFFIFIKLTAKAEVICQFVELLTQAVESYKQRMDWLTSGSQQVFGVILEQSITIVLDFGDMREEELSLCQDALIMVLREQVAHIAKFNIIR